MALSAARNSVLTMVLDAHSVSSLSLIELSDLKSYTFSAEWVRLPLVPFCAAITGPVPSMVASPSASANSFWMCVRKQ